jgi:hypothetical protein
MQDSSSTAGDYRGLSFVSPACTKFVTHPNWRLISAQGHGRAARAKPELVLNNFGTRLGHRAGRMLASLFHQDPQFRSRQVATFHNQRDFIFFRCAARGCCCCALGRPV